MKKYTAKQIKEAIKYWNRQLDRLNEDDFENDRNMNIYSHLQNAGESFFALVSKFKQHMNSHLDEYSLDVKLSDEQAVMYILISIIGIENVSENFVNKDFLRSFPQIVQVLAKSVRDFIKTHGVDPLTHKSRFYSQSGNGLHSYDPEVYESK